MATIKNFVPMTGRGQFDCSYIEASGTLMIEVKVFPEYQDKPSEKLAWSEKHKSMFEFNARKAIQTNWNGKHRFINRHSNPTQTVTPYFGVTFVPKIGDATIVMTVPRYPSAFGKGGLARCDSYVGLEQINTGNIHAQSKAMIHSQSTDPINVTLTEGPRVARDERERIAGIILSLGLNNIALTGGGTLPPQLKVDLAKFAGRTKLGTPSRPLIPIIVDAQYSTQHGATLGNVVKQGRAIRDLLGTFHLQNPVDFRMPKVNDLNLPNAGQLALNPDLAYETTFDEAIWMNIFAHEYGHMLGLPDEYDAMPPAITKVAKELAIHRFLDMTLLYETGKPDMGKMTTSIMCKGEDVLRCHMVTALQALCKMTKDEHWRVF